MVIYMLLFAGELSVTFFERDITDRQAGKIEPAVNKKSIYEHFLKKDYAIISTRRIFTDE